MTCISDGAYIGAAGRQAAAIVSQASVDVAIQTVIALWQRNSSRSISNMQTEIADEQVQLAEQLHAHAIKFWPARRAFVEDAFSQVKLTNDYVALPSAWGGILDETLNEGRADWLQMQQLTMCSNPSHCEDIRWHHNAVLMQADMMSYAARQGEGRVQMLNDWRYELQTSALALGKDQVRDLITYADMRGRMNTNLGDMLSFGVNTTLGMLGYYQRRALNSGWGTGISGTLRSVYAPPHTVQATPQVQTYPVIPPVSRAVSEPLEQEWSKDTEMQNVPDLRDFRNAGGY